mmetsp:Transcript_44766/g.97345  ORF Transcript_44766/g.97345 Transcript_44766/m.97345 type:complete len:256 (-) Transcript_44766:81-848(-)
MLQQSPGSNLGEQADSPLTRLPGLLRSVDITVHAPTRGPVLLLVGLRRQGPAAVHGLIDRLRDVPLLPVTHRHGERAARRVVGEGLGHLGLVLDLPQCLAQMIRNMGPPIHVHLHSFRKSHSTIGPQGGHIVAELLEPMPHQRFLLRRADLRKILHKRSKGQRRIVTHRPGFVVEGFQQSTQQLLQVLRSKLVVEGRLGGCHPSDHFLNAFAPGFTHSVVGLPYGLAESCDHLVQVLHQKSSSALRPHDLFPALL